MRQQYRAKNVIDYVSVRTGEETHVEPGDVFDDMNSVGVRCELEADNIEEVEEGDRK